MSDAWDETVDAVRRELAPALVRSSSEECPREAWRVAGKHGLTGPPVPTEYGGLGASAVETARRLEAVGYACEESGFVAALSAQLLSCVIPIWKRGTPDQRERFLRPLCAGELVAAHSATEREAGSDVFSMRCRATRTDGGYRLNGRKAFSLGAAVADLHIVFANVDPGYAPSGITAFLLERGTPGLSIGRVHRTVGLTPPALGDLTLDDCFVPVRNRLGDEGSGGFVFQLSMRWERTLIVASEVGVMRRLLEKSLKHARERVQFGRAIGHFQSVSNRIANMAVRLEVSRLVLGHAAETLDSGGRDAIEPSIAKLYISEAGLETAIDALRIHGASGYLKEAGVGSAVTDALGMTILSGTNDIHRQLICQSLGIPA
jgi:alkylation response protein AidB-like acyl-CoA dehydrogenase